MEQVKKKAKDKHKEPSIEERLFNLEMRISNIEFDINLIKEYLKLKSLPK